MLKVEIIMHNNNKKTKEIVKTKFIENVFFYLSPAFGGNDLGLLMLIGIIMYISLFKSEIGSKLRPRSMFQPPLFTYRYGHSFILFVIGCISAEIVGTLNFFLFIQIREIGREKVTEQKKSPPLHTFCSNPCLIPSRTKCVRM